jgi:hypothetical protein
LQLLPLFIQLLSILLINLKSFRKFTKSYRIQIRIFSCDKLFTICFLSLYKCATSIPEFSDNIFVIITFLVAFLVILPFCNSPFFILHHIFLICYQNVDSESILLLCKLIVSIFHLCTEIFIIHPYLFIQFISLKLSSTTHNDLFLIFGTKW